MKILNFIKNQETTSPLETILIGFFSVLFAIWLISILPFFGNQAINVIAACGGLGIWFIFTETVKTYKIFSTKRFKNLLLIADTLVFGSLILYLIHLFHVNLPIAMRIEFLLFLPAVSVPLYYDFIPGLVSIVFIYLSYFLVATVDKTNFGQGKILLQILSYLLVYILLSIFMQRKEEANSKLSKALEKVESLDKSKDTFIATASHELKGPVTILSGYLSMIKNDNLKPKDFKDAVNRAYEGSQNLSVLTKRLFDINRIQMHKLEINSSVFSIEDIGKDLITDYKNTNQNSNIKFCFKKTGKIPLVLADKELIKEVIINLLNNAMKFTNEGSITLSISENPSEVICAIKDTGKGISKEDQEKIFKKFYQTKESEASHLGLGLGLNLCHEIVKAHKGNIWVESELDKGSTFYFSIPKEPALVR